METGFTVQGVDHVTITTPAELEERTLDWYASCLGLERVEKPDHGEDHGGWFLAGTQEIHVVLDPQNPPRAAHFGVVVSDFAAVIRRLRGAGSHIEQARPIPGRLRCYTRDPAGNRIEIATLEGPPPETKQERT